VLQVRSKVDRSSISHSIMLVLPFYKTVALVLLRMTLLQLHRAEAAV
jgi:hypothetical protein